MSYSENGFLQAQSSPKGSFFPEREVLTMPGVVLEEELVSSIYMDMDHNGSVFKVCYSDGKLTWRLHGQACWPQYWCYISYSHAQDFWELSTFLF